MFDKTEFEHAFLLFISVYLSCRLLCLGTFFLSKFLFDSSQSSEEV